MKSEGMPFLRGTGRVYERDNDVTGETGGVVGVSKCCVESVSSVTGGVPGMVSNFVPAQIDCENSSSGEARRSMGGRFLEKGEPEASRGIWFSERGEKRVLWWIPETVVDAEEMDEAGEGGRGSSQEPRGREGVLETNLFERSR